MPSFQIGNIKEIKLPKSPKDISITEIEKFFLNKWIDANYLNIFYQNIKKSHTYYVDHYSNHLRRSKIKSSHPAFVTDETTKRIKTMIGLLKNNRSKYEEYMMFFYKTVHDNLRDKFVDVMEVIRIVDNKIISDYQDILNDRAKNTRKDADLTKSSWIEIAKLLFCHIPSTILLPVVRFDNVLYVFSWTPDNIEYHEKNREDGITTQRNKPPFVTKRQQKIAGSTASPLDVKSQASYIEDIVSKLDAIVDDGIDLINYRYDNILNSMMMYEKFTAMHDATGDTNSDTKSKLNDIDNRLGLLEEIRKSPAKTVIIALSAGFLSGVGNAIASYDIVKNYVTDNTAFVTISFVLVALSVYNIWHWNRDYKEIYPNKEE